MSIQYNYNRTGTERKTLVTAIAEILGEPAIYRKAPTFVYDIGSFSVNKNGMLSCSEEIDPETICQLIEQLKERGLVPESIKENDNEPQNNAEGISRTDVCANLQNISETATDPKMPHRFTIDIPNSGFTEEALSNLQKIIAGKEILLKKSLGVNDLSPIEITEKRIRFPWFILYGIEGETDAYSRLVNAICKMAKEQKRVIAKAADLQNEKFAMRIFLIRLGFIGDEYKSARKILLRNLAGNSSWKSGHRPEDKKAAQIVLEPEAVPTDDEKETENMKKGSQKDV